MVDLANDEMMQAGIIERCNSPWGFPIVLVEKKDGTKRFCIDFRALNVILSSDGSSTYILDTYRRNDKDAG